MLSDVFVPMSSVYSYATMSILMERTDEQLVAVYKKVSANATTFISMTTGEFIKTDSTVTSGSWSAEISLMIPLIRLKTSSGKRFAT